MSTMASTSKKLSNAAVACYAASITSQESMNLVAARAVSEYYEKAAERCGGADNVGLKQILEVMGEDIAQDKDPEKTILQQKFDNYREPIMDEVEAMCMESKLAEAYVQEQNLRERIRAIEAFNTDKEGRMLSDLNGSLFKGMGHENIFALLW